MWQILNGNNVDVLRQFPDNHFDSVVTDPPYGIDFLGKAWDATTGALETYQECLRVLKPGGHILAFSAARTYHHLAVTIEQAGFEIRDQIMWIYSSGFPKSQDIGKSIQRSLGVKETKINKSMRKELHNNTLSEATGKDRKIIEDYNDVKEVVCTDPEAVKWSGWGTALKPAHEPIVMARKPIKLSIARNCQQWGVGALNIDATRVPFADDTDKPSGGENGWSRVGFSEQPVEKYRDQKKKKSDIDTYLNNKRGPMERARIADGENIGMFDGGVGYKAIKRKVDPEIDLPTGRFPSNVIGEILQADYQKYFYCPKVGRAERHVGCVDPGPQTARARDENGNTLPYAEKVPGASPTMLAERLADSPGNNHPTVKPIELMKYLIRLVTPAGGHVLDPFNGSGSTGCAAVELDYDYTGIELDPKYVEIAEKRIAAWHDATHSNKFAELFE